MERTERFLESYRGDKLVARYSLSSPRRSTDLPPAMTSTSCLSDRVRRWLMDVFLPEGYPASVSADYLQYQTWDTVQAYASSITGALATQAVLQGLGVGDADTSLLAATITWILKDGCGMVGRIWFAWRFSCGLDALCKQWRLFADVLNDVALCLELVSPSFTPAVFKVCVFASSMMKSIVGVAGGATRASLVQHQALKNNMADVSAKDGSQETLVNLAALISSLFLLPLLSPGSTASWLVFAVFTAVHVYANYRAVQSVAINSLNRPRYFSMIQRLLNAVDLAETLWSHSSSDGFLEDCSGIKLPLKPGTQLEQFSVCSVNLCEPVLLDQALAVEQSVIAGWKLSLGASIENVFKLINPQRVADFLIQFQAEEFILLPVKRCGVIFVVFGRNASVKCQLRAILAAVVFAHLNRLENSALCGNAKPKPLPKMKDYNMRSVLNICDSLLLEMCSIFSTCSWNLDVAQMQCGEYCAIW